MTKKLIALTALAGLLAVGCSSHRGASYDEQTNPGYNGGPVRGPGTGGMGGTSTSPGGSQSGSGMNDNDTAPSNNSTAPSNPNSQNQTPDQSQSSGQSQDQSQSPK